MASAVIHLCVAKKVNEHLKMDERMIALGAIAPDISKQVGQTKIASHFIDTQNEDDYPNIDRFLKLVDNHYNGLNFLSNLAFLSLLGTKYLYLEKAKSWGM